MFNLSATVRHYSGSRVRYLSQRHASAVAFAVITRLNGTTLNWLIPITVTLDTSPDRLRRSLRLEFLKQYFIIIFLIS